MSQLPPAPAAPMPGPPEPAPPPPPRGPHRLEAALVALAVVGGLAVTAVAAATEPEGGGSVEPGVGGSAPDVGLEPDVGATPTGSSGATGSPVEEPVGEQPVTMFFSEWRFVRSGPSTCQGALSIEWGVESSGVLPIGDRVLIRVTGPGISRTYREPLTEQGVSIVVDVPSRNTGRVVAVPESVGARDVDGFVRVVAEDFC